MVADSRVLVRKIAYRHTESSTSHDFTLAGEARCVRRRLAHQIAWSVCGCCAGTYFGSSLYALIDPDCVIHGAVLSGTIERSTRV